MPTTSPRTRVGLIAVLGVSAMALLAGLFAAPAGAQTVSEEAARLHATPDQVQCMVDAGYQRPLAGDLRTREQRQAFRATAEECGIDLPPGFFRHAARIGARHWWRGLTAEERQCMKDEGVQRPVGWPSDEEIQGFRDAAATCEVDLPGGVADDAAA